MDNRYTGVFEQVDGWWIGHVEELPGCNVQERTLKQARESLKEAVPLIVQANRELARQESAGRQWPSAGLLQRCAGLGQVPL